MKQLDPLIGYQVSQGHLLQQYGLLFTLVYLLIVEEVQFKDVEYGIAFQFVSHLISVLTQTFNAILVKFTKISDSRLFTYSALIITSIAYYGCVIYCQVMFLNNFVFKNEANAAVSWLKLEISFFYANLFSTVVYLFLHSTAGLKIPQNSSIIKDPSTPTEYVETFDRELTFQQRIDKQDFLMATSSFLNTFNLFSTYFGVGVITLIYDIQEQQANLQAFNVPMIFLIISVSITFSSTAIHQFGPAAINGLIEIIISAVSALGVIISLIILLVRTNRYTIEEYKISPSLIRHYSLTIFFTLVIIVVLAIAFLLIILKLNKSKKATAGDANFQKVENTDKTEKKPKSLCNENRTMFNQPNLNQVSFTVDYYTVSYLTYFCLFDLSNREALEINQQENQTQQTNIQAPEEEALTQQVQLDYIFEDQQLAETIQNASVGVHSTDAARQVSSCLFIFMIQMCLVSLVFIQFTSSTYQVETSSYSVLLCRVLCSVLLHMQLSGEILQSILMFNFARCHVTKPKFQCPMLMMGLMQFIASLATESINILLICAQNNVQDVLMNYIALGVIAEIDDYYASTLTNNKVKNVLEEVTLPINEETFKNNRSNSEWWLFSTWIYKAFMRTLYQSYYFYFMPLTVIMISYFYQVNA